MSKAIRVMSLYKIENSAKRRAVIVGTLPLIFASNIILAAIGWIVFSFVNQRELFRSAAHYWNSSERITDDD